MTELIVLLPATRHFHASPASAGMAIWLARGNRLETIAGGRTASLRSLFEFTGISFPVAALTHYLDSGDIDDAMWLRADPCHVAADAVAVRMYASEIPDLSTADAQALAKPLRPMFGDAGFPLEITKAGRWYLRCPPSAQLPDFADPDDVLGDDLLQHLPSGSNEHQWRHLLNEAQVVLHNHPLNASRVAHGQVPVNSLWFWGAGASPPWVRTKLSRVMSRDPVVMALASRAGIPIQDTEPTALSGPSDEGRVLVDLAMPAGWEDLARWTQTLNAALMRGEFGSMRLVFADGEIVIARRGHRWRFWRRVKR